MRAPPRGLWPLALLLALGAACSDSNPTEDSRDAGVEPADAAPLDVGEPDAGPEDASRPDVGRTECDPLIPEVCALPWPSNFYLEGPTGEAELRFLEGSLPINRDRVAVDENRLQVHDGYSVDTPIVVLFPNVDLSGLPTEVDIAPSLADDASILLYRREGIDLVRVPYWVETDAAEADSSRRLLFVRPAERLLPDSLYIVAFRGLRTEDGALLPRSEAFQRLLDRDTEGTQLATRQGRFDELLSSLVEEGVGRDELQLAWDFETVSRRRLVFRLETMRRTYDEFREQNGPIRFAITSTVVREGDPERLVTLLGEMQVPWFLRPEVINGVEGEVLNTAGNPAPIPVDVRPVPFRIELPTTAGNDFRDPPRSTVVQVGHPAFTSADIIETASLLQLSNAQRLILVGTDWLGMTDDDAELHAAATRDLNLLQFVVDRLHQGFVNQWALTDVMQDYFGNERLLSLLNTVPKDVHFYGLESAAGLGPALLATNPGLERGVLAAGSFDVVSNAGRSALWSSYLRGPGDDLVDGYGSVADAWVAVLTAQMFYDYVMSSLYVGYLDAAAPPFTASRALFTGVKGDRIAPTVDLEVLARSSTYTVSLLQNPPEGRALSLVEPAPYPLAGSGVVLFDLGAPYPPPGIRVPDGAGPDPHDLLFDLEAHRTLLRRFVETGVIEDVCGGGPCVFDAP